MPRRTRRLLSIVVPVYYNEGSLDPLAKALASVESRLLREGVGLQLIFVDDGSGDTSWQRLLAIKRRRPATTLVKLSRNFGAVHASKTGFRWVKGDAFMVLAADLQDPPELVLEMVRHWEAGSRFVICERITRQDPWVSKLFSRIYYTLLRRLVIQTYPWGGYDMALMDKAMLSPILQSAKSVFTPLLAYWMGFTPTVIKYHRPARAHGRSRWTFGKKYHAFLDVMLGFSITPIRLISSLGALISMAAFGYGIVVVVAATRGQIPVQGFPTLVALLSFLLGLVILMLGVIGEYLWRIFEELNHRPETIVEEVR